MGKRIGVGVRVVIDMDFTQMTRYDFDMLPTLIYFKVEFL